jgi:hypothetical protein
MDTHSHTKKTREDSKNRGLAKAAFRLLSGHVLRCVSVLRVRRCFSFCVCCGVSDGCRWMLHPCELLFFVCAPSFMFLGCFFFYSCTCSFPFFSMLLGVLFIYLSLSNFNPPPQLLPCSLFIFLHVCVCVWMTACVCIYTSMCVALFFFLFLLRGTLYLRLCLLFSSLDLLLCLYAFVCQVVVVNTSTSHSLTVFCFLNVLPLLDHL